MKVKKRIMLEKMWSNDMLYVMSFFILYSSVLFLDFIVFIIYDGEVLDFFILSNFVEPLFPSLLTLLVGVFLGKLIKLKNR